MLNIGSVYKAKRKVEVIDSWSSKSSKFSFVAAGTLVTVLRIERNSNRLFASLLIQDKKYEYYLDLLSGYPEDVLIESDWERIC